MEAQTSVIPRPNLLAGEEFPPQPRQKRSVDNRARLKTTALALFGERGYERTSIEEIARRANLAVGGFYLHYRSKRQLLLALMDDLLEGLNRLKLQPKAAKNVREGLRELLGAAFSADLRYLGAYRAWEEAMLSDTGLGQKQEEIRAWTTVRVRAVFERLQELPGARQGVDIAGLAQAMDSFFWNLLAQAVRLSNVELNQWIDSATHLIYHALFYDPPKEGGKI